MFVKKFQATSLEKALSLVKGEMGPDALILSTEHKKKGWFKSAEVEVTAAHNPEADPQASRSSTPDLEKVFPHRKQKPEAPAPLDRSSKMRTYSAMTAVQPSSLQKERLEGYERSFVRLGISAKTAREFTQCLVFEYSKEDLEVPALFQKAQTRVLLSSVRTFSEEAFLRRKHWVLVGPAGAGKTSALVKLALFLKRQKKHCRLVSGESRKLLGVYELGAYAKLLKLPYSSKPLSEPMDSEISLIDGPAISIEGGPEGNEVPGCSCVLVLDVTSRLNEMLKILDQSMGYRPEAVLFTKLDQALQLGVIVDFIKHSRLPLLGGSASASFKTPFRFYDAQELMKMTFRTRGEA